MASIGRRGVARADAWPVWVDALSNLLIVVIFVLMVFVMAQAYLSTSLSGRDQALQQLNRQLTELGELLAMEREANADLRVNFAQLSAELQTSTLERERLAAGLAELRNERDALQGRLSLLTSRTDRGAAELAQASRELEEAYRVIEADRSRIEVQLRELASLQADIRALREAREQLEGQVAALSTLVDESRAATAQAERTRTETAEELRLTREDRERLMAELGTLRDRAQALESRVATEEERTVLAQREVERRDTRIEELVAAISGAEQSLSAEKATSAEAQEQVALLNRQIAELRQQLLTITSALDASETETREQQAQIADLGRRLNLALASKVEELNRYRSEFFGRLRGALGERPDIRIVGDRFVFQSEVLFNSGSAFLEERGREELGKLAATLLEISRGIPPDVNWVLRVDGHTDLRPINTPQFPSNWELSTARAIAVVRFLREQGIPADRLAAAGFAEFQPIDASTSEAAFARNRRIEIKFDQR